MSFFSYKKKYLRLVIPLLFSLNFFFLLFSTSYIYSQSESEFLVEFDPELLEKKHTEVQTVTVKAKVFGPVERVSLQLNKKAVTDLIPDPDGNVTYDLKLIGGTNEIRIILFNKDHHQYKFDHIMTYGDPDPVELYLIGGAIVIAIIIWIAVIQFRKRSAY